MAGTKVRHYLNALPPALTSLGFWLVLALVVRLGLVYWQYSGDVHNHFVWGAGVLTAGTDFFKQQFPGFNQPNYPSLTLYLFAFSFWLYQAVNGLVIWLNQTVPAFPSLLVPLFASANMQLAFLKLPAILGDLGIGLILAILAREKKSGLWLALLYWFNPAVIYVGTVWGQIESLPVFFLLLAAFYTQKKRLYLAVLAMTAAILTKQTALWLVPFYLVWWYCEFRLDEFLKAGFLALVVFCLSFLPLGLGPLASLSWYLETLSGSSVFVSDAAWNLWHWLYRGQVTADSVLLGPISVRVWSLGLVGLSFVILVWRQLKQKHDFFTILFLASTAAFFFQTRVHERHLFPALVLLLLARFPAKAKLIAYAGLSVYFLANLITSLRLPFI